MSEQVKCTGDHGCDIKITEQQIVASFKNYIDCCVAYYQSHEDQYVGCTTAGDMIDNLYGNHCISVPNDKEYLTKLAVKCINEHAEVTLVEKQEQYLNVAVTKQEVVEKQIDWSAEWDRRCEEARKVSDEIDAWWLKERELRKQAS